MSDSATKPTPWQPNGVGEPDNLFQVELPIFNALPGAYLLLSRELIIEAVSDTYLQATFTQREQLLGRYIFDVFPDNPDAPNAHAVENLRASLQQVLATGQPHEMARQQYDVPDPLNPNAFVLRYWLPRNTPVLDAQGRVSRIIHAVVNVTENVRFQAQLAASEEREAQANAAVAEKEQAWQQVLVLNQELDARVATRTRELQEAQQKAEWQKERMQHIFMQAPVAIGIFTGERQIVELVNPMMCELLGRPARELLGKSIFDAVPEMVGQGFEVIFSDVYTTAVPFEAKELPATLLREGQLELRYYNGVYQPLKNERQEVTAVIQIVTDATEQVKSRQALETSAHQLKLITDALPVLIGYLDKEQRYRFTNYAYKAWFHQEPEELLGRSVREVVGEKAYSGVKKYIERALAGERLNFEATMPFREDFLKCIQATFVPDVQDGEVVGFFTLVSDITEQVEARRAVEKGKRQAQALAAELAVANEELRAANNEIQSTNSELSATNKQLKRINADLDNFIYTASHDLKAPILNVEGLVDALLEELPPESLQLEPVQHVVDLILDSVKRFKRTLEHLTEVSKFEKTQSTAPAKVDLREVVADVQKDLALAIKAAQAQIKVNVSSCPTILFSRKNLRSIVYNLLSNAIKYRSPDRAPLISIDCHETEQCQVLSVSDNGLGMDMSQKKKLFAMFQRLHSHVEGSGVGLYMVKKIIENAGGRIEVQSKVGEGATFHVYFPRTS